MMKFMKIVVVCCLMLGFVACKQSVTAPNYTVSKVFKTDSGTTVNVRIDRRVTGDELVAIAGKLKSDSSQWQNLNIRYLLPGNSDITTGDNSYYAGIKYINESNIKSVDTLKDDNGNVIRLKVWGLSHEKVKHLLGMQPAEIAGKNVMGRFIDDYNHTVIIPFTDSKNELYIIELDSAAKVVSATMPLKVKEGAIEKWHVTEGGDYITLKDSVLSQYGADSYGIPFNSIRSGR